MIVNIFRFLHGLRELRGGVLGLRTLVGIKGGTILRINPTIIWSGAVSVVVEGAIMIVVGITVGWKRRINIRVMRWVHMNWLMYMWILIGGGLVCL